MPNPSFLRNCVVAACCAAAALAAGCDTDSGLLVGIVHPTLVEVAPEEFLGSLPCSDAPGAMRRYVATLVDVTEGLDADAASREEFALPSSGPVRCDQNVAFNFVAPGHLYAADIAGYDRTDLRPLETGSPIMVDASGGVVEPRWTTSCGRGSEAGDEGADAGLGDDAGADATVSDAASEAETGIDPFAPTLAVNRRTRRVRGCRPLLDHGAVGETAITVDVQAALGALACGGAAGQVSRFRATLVATGDVREAACGESVTFSGLVAGRFHELFVEAFEQDASLPRWGSRCQRRAEAGTTLPATCDPLSEVGSLAVDVAALLTARSVACSDLALLELALDARVIGRTQRDCATPAVFDELLPGEQRVTATITLRSDASGPLLAECTAVVAPGRTVFASCSAP